MIVGQRDEVALDIGDGLVQLGARRHGTPAAAAWCASDSGATASPRPRGKNAGVLREQPLEPFRDLARIARVADPQPLADQVVGPDRRRGAVANRDIVEGRVGIPFMGSLMRPSA